MLSFARRVRGSVIDLLIFDSSGRLVMGCGDYGDEDGGGVRVVVESDGVCCSLS